MPNSIQCPGCASLNRPDAVNCRICGRRLESPAASSRRDPPVALQRVTSGEVFTAVVAETAKKQAPDRATEGPATAAATATSVEPNLEDNSDVLAAAVDGIRAKAQGEGHRFKPYVRSSDRKAPNAVAEREAAKHLHDAVALLREMRFADAIEPLLKSISRDDEDRRPWILLAEAYLRLGRPYKSAVGYLRALELSPKDEQAWLGLGRVLRMLGDTHTAAAILDRATLIHPTHAETWMERGLIFESLQNLPEASVSFAKVLELRPEHRLAQEKAQEIGPKIAQSRASAAAALATVEIAPAAAESSGPTAEEERERDILDEMEEAFSIETSLTAERSGAAVVTQVAEAPARVRTFVEGLDETLEGGVPWGHVVLIEGAPGTMKSSLGFSILLQNAARAGLHCLYLSLEERGSSLLKQMGSLGLHLEVPKGSLVVLDPRSATNLLDEKKDWLDGLREGIWSVKAQRGLDLIVIDSLEALEVLAKFKDRRREIYRLFEWLRDLGITSFLVTERPDWVVAGHVLQGRWDEEFLADGVIHLRMHLVTDSTAQRRLRVVKMRGTKHNTGYLAMDFDEGRFRVTRAMSS